MKKWFGLVLIVFSLIYFQNSFVHAKETIIDISKGAVFIDDNGYTQNGVSYDYEGIGYTISGSLKTNDTAIIIDKSVAVDLVFRNLSIEAEFLSNDLIIVKNLGSLKIYGNNLIEIRKYDKDINAINLSGTEFDITGSGQLEINLYGNDFLGTGFKLNGKASVFVDISCNIGHTLFACDNKFTYSKGDIKADYLSTLLVNNSEFTSSFSNCSIDINESFNETLIEAYDLIFEECNLSSLNTLGTIKANDVSFIDSSISCIAKGPFIDAQAISINNSDFSVECDLLARAKELSYESGNISLALVIAEVDVYSGLKLINGIVRILGVYYVYGEANVDYFVCDDLIVSDKSTLIIKNTVTVKNSLINNGEIKGKILTKDDIFDSSLNFTLNTMEIDGLVYNPLTGNISNDKFTWDYKTKTLTLKGLALRTLEHSIILPSSSIIIVEDENQITSIKGSPIYCEGNLKIMSHNQDGTLILNSNNCAIEAFFLEVNDANLKVNADYLINNDYSGISMTYGQSMHIITDLSLLFVNSTVVLNRANIHVLGSGLFDGTKLVCEGIDALEFNLLYVISSQINSIETKGLIKASICSITDTDIYSIDDFGEALILANSLSVSNSSIKSNGIWYTIYCVENSSLYKTKIDIENQYGGIYASNLKIEQSDIMARTFRNANAISLIESVDIVFDDCKLDLYSYAIATIKGVNINLTDCELNINNSRYYAILCQEKVEFNGDNIGIITAPLSTIYAYGESSSIVINDVREIYNDGKIFEKENRKVMGSEEVVYYASNLEFDYAISDMTQIYLGTGNLYLLHIGDNVITWYYDRSPIVYNPTPGYKFDGWVDKDGNYVDFSIPSNVIMDIYPKESIIDSTQTTEALEPTIPEKTPANVVLGVAIGCVGSLLVIGVTMFVFGYRHRHKVNEQE